MVSSNALRKTLLEVALECGNAVHLGGSLSEIEILNVLYRDVLRYKSEDPSWEDRDFFVLSKGHSFLGLITVLNAYGFFPREKLFQFQKGGDGFISHPVKDLSVGVESSTGSLGHGLSYALGLAKAAQISGQKDRRAFALLGDSECSEGSVWEAALLGPKLGVTNLVAIVDANGLGNDRSGVVPPWSQLAEMFRAAGWLVQVVDGHNEEELGQALEVEPLGQSPHAVIARTVKGKGISFMENNNDWHHSRVTQRVFEQAITELDGPG